MQQRRRWTKEAKEEKEKEKASSRTGTTKKKRTHEAISRQSAPLRVQALGTETLSIVAFPDAGDAGEALDWLATALPAARAEGGAKSGITALAAGPAVGATVVVVPSCAAKLVPPPSDASVDHSWAVLQASFPDAPPGSKPSLTALASVHNALSTAGILWRTLPAAANSSIVLVRDEDLPAATVALVRDGHTVGPASRVCPPIPEEDPSASEKNAQFVGLWTLLKREEPVEVTIEEHVAGEGPIRIQAPSGLYAEIRLPKQSERTSTQRSCAGHHALVDLNGRQLSLRHRVLDFQPPTGAVLCTQVKIDREVMGELSHPRSRCRDEYIEVWTRVEEGPVTALELISEVPPKVEGPRPRIGYWLFAGGRFARVLGLPKGDGLVAGSCCSSLAQLEAIGSARAVRKELRGLYEACWGKIEAPGCFKIMKDAWSKEKDGTVLYDASADVGGSITVSEGEVIHRLPDGGEQRWRVRDWGFDPFRAAGPSSSSSASGSRSRSAASKSSASSRSASASASSAPDSTPPARSRSGGRRGRGRRKHKKHRDEEKKGRQRSGKRDGRDRSRHRHHRRRRRRGKGDDARGPGPPHLPPGSLGPPGTMPPGAPYYHPPGYPFGQGPDGVRRRPRLGEAYPGPHASPPPPGVWMPGGPPPGPPPPRANAPATQPPTFGPPAFPPPGYPPPPAAPGGCMPLVQYPKPGFGPPPPGFGPPPLGFPGPPPGFPPGQPPPPGYPHPLAHLANSIANFAADNKLDRKAEEALRALHPELQHRILLEGHISGSNPSAVLMSRIRALESSSPAAATAAAVAGVSKSAVGHAPLVLGKYEAAARSSAPPAPSAKVQAEPLMPAPKADAPMPDATLEPAAVPPSTDESMLQSLHKEVLHRKAITKGLHKELKVQLCLPQGHPTPKGMTVVPAGGTVAMLKKQIEEEFRIRAENAALEFSGRNLKENWVLTDCGVSDGGLIHVVPRAPTAAAPPKAAVQAKAGPQIPPEERRKANACRPLDDDTGAVTKDSDVNFLVYSAVQDDKLASVMSKVRQVAAQHFAEDYIGRISMASGYRLTLLVTPGQTELADVPMPFSLGKGGWKGIWKGIWNGLMAHRRHLQTVPKQSAILGVMVYRFRQNVIHVVQIAIADEHRGRGLGRKAVEWLVQYAKKFNMDAVALSSTPEGVAFYETCGLQRQVGLKSLDGQDRIEGRVLMEYRLTPSAFELALKVAADGSPVPREQLVPMVFTLLDTDANGYLDMSEMRNFANRIGFTGSDDEWAEEYKRLKYVSDSKGGPEAGIDEPRFGKLVNDRSDEGCYCTDDELRNMVVKLMPKNEPAVAAEPEGKMSRKDLVAAVFRMCDRDGDGLLNSAELRNFASHTGFDDNDEAWATEYKNLCREVSANTSSGVGLFSFTSLVDDNSDNGCYCTDDELQTMLQIMKADCLSQEQQASRASKEVQPSPARSALIAAVFELLDKDNDNLLKEHEMRAFAGFTGYEGSDEQWQADFKRLCVDLSVDPALGLATSSLEKLVNDLSECGLYCSDEELQSIKAKLQVGEDNTMEGERTDLIRDVFKGCDFDGNGYLNEMEMRVISNHLGFEGSDENWTEEFKLLCADNQVEPSMGVDLALALKLLNDRTDRGCYCSDEELRSLLAKLQEPDAKAKLLQKSTAQASEGADSKESLRADLIAAVFRACDVDRDGQLDEKEMRTFAGLTGFEGSDDEWTKEFRSLCADKGAMGVSAEHFDKLVNDKSDSGIYCGYDELKTILDKLRFDIKDSAGADRPVTPGAESAVAPSTS